MDKIWVQAPRSTLQYREVVRKFIKLALTTSGSQNCILCPCKKCGNRYWLEVYIVSEHVLVDGFMSGYSSWLFHGETAEPDLEEEQSNVECEEEQSNVECEYNSDSDEIDKMLMEGFGMYDVATLGEHEVEGDRVESAIDINEFRKLVNDGSQDLYPGCKLYSKLQFLVKLLHIKNLRRMSNGCFDAILTLFKETLPEGHSLPKNFHDSKKYIKAVGLGYESVHACKNDCMLFNGVNADLETCTVCHTSRWKSVKTGSDGKRVHKVPQKVARHFQLDKTINRIFLSSETGPHMSWYNVGRTRDGLLRHPADSPAWKHFDAKHKWFADESRNIRFGLATDGFNPFGNKNLSYSIWPIILIPYNLPPWMCMKQSNFILSVIVPGRKTPCKEMDIYMQLVLDDLKRLWEKGLMTYDAHLGEKFRVHAALLWTISDWPGRGYMSGESIAVCLHCLTNTCSRWLKHGRKTCYLGHRRFLDANHPYRFDGPSFDGNVELGEPPVQLSGKEIYELTKGLKTVYGKLQKKTNKKRKRQAAGEEVEDNHNLSRTFKKRSCFFQLPYWETLLVRHNLDAMHIEKSFFDNIINTLLDDKRSKDDLNARLDLKHLNIREELHPDETDIKKPLPDALYHLSSDKKKMLCELLKNARFPDGYASNLFDKVHVDEKKLVGLKSHDCHIIMQDLLPLALSRILPEEVSAPLIHLCEYFKLLNGKVINVSEMQRLEAEIPSMAEKNKATRENQLNGTHTAGSRSFAVVRDQMEQKEGRRVSRSEVYLVTHTTKKGLPVDAFAASKIDEINKNFEANPSLIGENAHDGDLYSTLFPKEKNTRMNGLGLLVGGKTSEKFDQVVAALQKSNEENTKLRSMVEILMKNQNALLAKTQKMEEKWNEISANIATQKQQQTKPEQEVDCEEENLDQGQKKSHIDDTHPQPNLTETSQPNATPQLQKTSSNGTMKRKDATQDHLMNIGISEGPSSDIPNRTYKQLQSEAETFKKVKIEVVEEFNAERDKMDKMVARESNTSEHKKRRVFKTPRQKEYVKCGMEVGLTSPNSAQVVAMGTIQKIDKDYVEVLVNIVLKDSTMLPQAQGRIRNMGHAQARSIQWPLANVTSSSSSTISQAEVTSSSPTYKTRKSRKGGTSKKISRLIAAAGKSSVMK